MSASRSLLLAGLLVSVRADLNHTVCRADVSSCFFGNTCPHEAHCIGLTCVCRTAFCAENGECVPTAQAAGPQQQPKLTPEAWFLTEAELRRSRGGEPRGFEVFTRGNDAHVFVEGAEYFSDLYDHIQQLTDGDQLLVASWMAGPSYQLSPELDAAGSANTSWIEVLRRATDRNVGILMLVWRNLYYANVVRRIHEFTDTVRMLTDAAKNRACVLASNCTTPPSRVDAYIDARIQFPGSIHQKFNIVKRKEDVWPKVWVGGLDVCRGRWDVFGSNTTYPKAADGKLKAEQEHARLLKDGEEGPVKLYDSGYGDGFHDLQVGLRGPAAVDMTHSFLERWNEPRCAGLTMKADLKSLPRVPEPLEMSSMFPADGCKPNGTTGVCKPVGTSAVQVLRTYSCRYAWLSGCYNGYAKHGEVSIHRAFLKAIKTARYYIYIEDQYFSWVDQEIYDALRDALRRGVRQMIVLCNKPGSLDYGGMSTWIWKLWHPLWQEFPDRVHTFYRKHGVYVHSKTKIIDDVWVMIGSANMNPRSHFSDAEIDVGIVDEGPRARTSDGIEVSKFALDLRQRLWQDSTGILPEEWQALTIDQAARRWTESAEEEGSRHAKFNYIWGRNESLNVPAYVPWADNAMYRLMALFDGDGRCGKYTIFVEQDGEVQQR